jgi:hypothetical protein
MESAQLRVTTFDEAKDRELLQKKIIPYLKEIYKDLYSKEIFETPGLNNLIFKEYCQLPGFIEDRF